MHDLKLTAHPLDELEDTVLLSPEGTIRGPTTASFREHVDGLLEQTQTTSLVIDFSQVQSIDSSTAGFLLNVHDRLGGRGGRLALAALTPSVQVVIDSIGLTTFFSVYPTLDDAVQELGTS